MYDLRLSLTEGSYLNQSDVLNAVRSIDHAEWITAASPRLIIRTLVDASTTSQTIMVPGRLIGMPVAGSEPVVNALSVMAGMWFRGGTMPVRRLPCWNTNLRPIMGSCPGKRSG